jgi:hypothetical protein
LAEISYGILEPYLRNWAGLYLSRIFISGAYAKGTAFRGSTDIDIFISLRSNYPNLRGKASSTIVLHKCSVYVIKPITVVEFDNQKPTGSLES